MIWSALGMLLLLVLMCLALWLACTHELKRARYLSCLAHWHTNHQIRTQMDAGPCGVLHIHAGCRCELPKGHAGHCCHTALGRRCRWASHDGAFVSHVAYEVVSGGEA